jgi:hypothetical protein
MERSLCKRSKSRIFKQSYIQIAERTEQAVRPPIELRPRGKLIAPEVNIPVAS